MYYRLGLLNFLLRSFEKPQLRWAQNIPKFRKRFLRQARWAFASPANATYLPDTLEHSGMTVPALWANGAGPKRDGVILFLHGGAYVFGAPASHKAMLARLSEQTGMRAILPAYRLAPENPFPAAIEDALAAYQALIARGYAPENIVLGGDSAGGGLMLALLHVICQENLPRPGAVFAMSPWTDLTLSGPSIVSNAAVDPVLPADRISESGHRYLDGQDPMDPRASPLFGDFKGGPPVLIQVGSTEILLDDSQRMAEALKAQRVDVQLDVWKNTPHVWQIFQGHLAEADRALDDIASFIHKALP
ncbi:MAG: monoterpene epsilon-lactone hydrolase [Paracoccaceae bacterium]|jgi:monoterpene epsilon-lactone hydrolase